MKRALVSAVVFGFCSASLCTAASAVDYSGGYVYWPGHFEGSYEVHAPDTTIGDRSVRIDPVAILMVIAEAAAQSQDSKSNEHRVASRNLQNYASELCSLAALERVEGTDGIARIDAVHRFGDLYAVRGKMENTSGRYRFNCSATAGAVQDLDIKPIKLSPDAYGPEIR
jgi:hypothetical protein